MDALIADLSVAVVPNPVPAAMLKIAERMDGSRSAPGVPIEASWNGTWRVFAKVATNFVGDAPSEIDFANDPLVQFLDSFDNVR